MNFEAKFDDFIFPYKIYPMIQKIANKYKIEESELISLCKDKTNKTTSHTRCEHRFTKGMQIGQQCQNKVSGNEVKCTRHRNNQKLALPLEIASNSAEDMLEKLNINLDILDSDDSE